MYKYYASNVLAMTFALLCKIALLGFVSSAIGQAVNPSSPADPRPPKPSGAPTGENNVPFCFRPPDGEIEVSLTEGTCKGLFEEFKGKFGDRSNTTLYWTGNNSQRHEPDVVHLPKVYFKINDDETQACELELTDGTLVGDNYPPISVVEAAAGILDYCFSNNLCGEIALPPHYTTSLAICATIHNKPGTILQKTRLIDPSLMPGSCPNPQIATGAVVVERRAT